MNSNNDEYVTEQLRNALAEGNPDRVRALIDAGADVSYRTEQGYDALINAVHGRDVLRDPHLIELLNLLIERGVSLTGMSSYGESAVRVLSRIGRFDAVELLLKAGANPDDIAFTPLMAAVAFGSLEEVERIVTEGADLEERDDLERTAWLIAIQTGDLGKARFLLERGARRDARGRCGMPPLFFAIENYHTAMMKWLIEIGMDINERDDFGDTALSTAATCGNSEAIDILLRAGADVNRKTRHGGALSDADTRDAAMRLLQAGADPQELTSNARRAILGYPPEPDPDLLRVSRETFRKFRVPRYGKANPERMNNPFWEGMIRSGLTAYGAGKHFGGAPKWGRRYRPTWCAERFGQSITFLEDGRIVQIAGEHEDYYDPDFCIYNDVFVNDPVGNVTIYGYPETIFPPTDFHTAILIGRYIYVVGSLGYMGARQYGYTPVYRLDIDTFRMEPLETTGENPGWIYKHRAVLLNEREIQISGGVIVDCSGEEATHSENTGEFILNVESLAWRRAG